MSKNKNNYEDIVEKFYYYLKYKMHLDDFQASTIIFSIFILPISVYLGFYGNNELFKQLFYINIGLDIVSIVYSIIKKKYFGRKIINETESHDKIITINNFDDVDKLSPYEFERFAAKYYKMKGYKTEITRTTHDYGADVIAEKGTICVAIQVKKYGSRITKNPILNINYAMGHYKANRATLFTNNELTAQAKLAAQQLGVKIVDKYSIKQFLRNNPAIKFNVKVKN